MLSKYESNPRADAGRFLVNPKSNKAQLSNLMSPNQKRWVMFSLVLAGESVFILPFLLPRIFRPTFLEVLGISNTELGIAMSVYGIVAMCAYFPSGPLADWFRPNRLMATALIATAAVSATLMVSPTGGTLIWVYGIWGCTTILLFWSALMRATRHLAAETDAGFAFGVLDGGRGLVAAIISSVAVELFARYTITDGGGLPSLSQRVAGLRAVTILFIIVVVFAALLTWLVVPSSSDTGDRRKRGTDQQLTFAEWLPEFLRILRQPQLWLQSLILLCAYVGYKTLDDISLFGTEVLNMSETNAASVAASSMWVRPVAAIGAGWIADRTRISYVTAIAFAAMTVLGAFTAMGGISSGQTSIFVFVMIATSAAVFALRGLYFAIMQEGKMSIALTGTVVGTVSVIGYTPEIFMGPLMGVFLDAEQMPVERRHQMVFWIMTGFAMVGVFAALLYAYLAKDASKKPSQSE